MDGFCESFRGYRLDEVLGAWKPFDEVVHNAVERSCKAWKIPFDPADARAIYAEIPSWNPHPDVPAGLAKVAREIPLVILSNSMTDLIPHSVAKLGAPFHAAYTAQEAQAYKPLQQAFEYMFDSLGCRPEDVMHCSSSLRYDLMTAYDMKIGRRVFVNRGHEPGIDFYGYQRDQEHRAAARPARALIMLRDFDPASVTFGKGHFIAGAVVDEPGERIAVARPSDGADYADLPVASAETVDRAVNDAAEAVRRSGWATQPPRERARAMRRWAELIEAGPRNSGRLEALGSTRPIAQAVTGDVAGTAEGIRFFSEWADKLGGDVAATAVGPSRHDRLRALWRGRRDHALELPAEHGVAGRSGRRWRRATPSC